VQVTKALGAYVAKELVVESEASIRAGMGAGVTSVHSPPVNNDGAIVAVAAFSYSPTRHPVEVLSYTSGHWSAIATLGIPSGFEALNADQFYLSPDQPVSVADVTGDGRPDFLIRLMAADNTPGVVVSQDGGRWRYVPNSGPFPTTEVLIRDPAFQGRRLISFYNDCDPNCATAHVDKMVWTYEPSTGEFWSPNPPGWTAPAGSVNHR
jgi:hypothetical protein